MRLNLTNGRAIARRGKYGNKAYFLRYALRNWGIDSNVPSPYADIAVVVWRYAFVIATMRTIALGAAPAGALLAGLLGGALGLRATLLIGAIGIQLGVVILSPSAALRVNSGRRRSEGSPILKAKEMPRCRVPSGCGMTCRFL